MDGGEIEMRLISAEEEDHVLTTIRTLSRTAKQSEDKLGAAVAYLLSQSLNTLLTKSPGEHLRDAVVQFSLLFEEGLDPDFRKDVTGVRDITR